MSRFLWCLSQLLTDTTTGGILSSVCVFQSRGGAAQVGFALMSVTHRVLGVSLLQGRVAAGWDPEPAGDLPKLLLQWCHAVGWDGVRR